MLEGRVGWRRLVDGLVPPLEHERGINFWRVRGVTHRRFLLDEEWPRRAGPPGAVGHREREGLLLAPGLLLGQAEDRPPAPGKTRCVGRVALFARLVGQVVSAKRHLKGKGGAGWDGRHLNAELGVADVVRAQADGVDAADGHADVHANLVRRLLPVKLHDPAVRAAAHAALDIEKLLLHPLLPLLLDRVADGFPPRLYRLRAAESDTLAPVLL
mmetsp:Transcript_48292/g.161021  ORF Transcript_48292/g.161021 Transcript_48292/m.161021 type:complete len:214 (-) Transcript_48292:391-1032(-)